MKTKTLIFILSVICISGLFTYVYYQRGGFNEPIIKTVNQAGRTIHGTTFKGGFYDTNFRKLQAEYGDRIKAGELKGQFVRIFKTPPSEIDQIEVFVGALLLEGHENLPDSSITYFLPSKKYLQANTNAHPSVALGPERLYKKLEDYAKTQGLKIDATQFIELYTKNGELMIEVPIITE